MVKDITTHEVFALEMRNKDTVGRLTNIIAANHNISPTEVKVYLQDGTELTSYVGENDEVGCDMKLLTIEDKCVWFQVVSWYRSMSGRARHNSETSIYQSLFIVLMQK